MANKRLTIAVDFGTTYSGVAYAVGTDFNEPILIKDWASGPTSDKVPTVLRYNASDRIGGVLGLKWGFDVKSHERRQEWFKLALDPMVYMPGDCVDMTQSYPNELADPPDYSRSPTKLCTDYLTALRKQAWRVLEDHYGSSTLSNYRVSWVITVPAVWSTKAKDDTLTCARNAGIGSNQRSMIVSEPEAAAAYALQAIEPMTLKTGQNFVICDAGGGTVDLITYRLLNLDPLNVEESAIPSGGKCGGTFVNRIFEKKVMERIGANSGLTDFGKHQLMQNFENYAKREFKGSEDDEWFIPAAGARNNAAAGISGGSLIITLEHMKQAFDPVVDEVVKLVQRQISGIRGNEKSVKAVVLVGGFGASRYLRQRIREAIGPIELLCPPNQWGAVALGAVIHGVANSSGMGRTWNVESRHAISHFGIDMMEPFDASKHDAAHKVWDACEGKNMCNDIMSWFVNRGDSLSDSAPKEYQFYRNIRVGARLKINEEMVYSHEETAPKYYESAVCRDHATLRVDLTPVKNRLRQIRGKDGKDYYRVDFQILATFHSAHVEYRWQFQGQEFDKITVNYV